MSSGDAYIYCLIISDNVAGKVNTINQIRDGIDREVKVILNKIDEGRAQDPIVNYPEDGKRGLELLEQERKWRGEIIKLCKKPIAIYHVASDDWDEAYHACSQAEYLPLHVSEFLEHANGKLWCKEDLEKKHYDATCICFPSHYDCDEEFLEELGVNTRNLEDYNKGRMTHPITGNLYALVNITTGKVSQYGDLIPIAFEWAKQTYELKNQDGEFDVRELYVHENRVFDTEEIQEIIGKASEKFM